MTEFEIYKQQRIAEVAEKTESLIEEHGFVFGAQNQTFDLDPDSRQKWLALATMENSLSWPLDISPRTGVYTLTRANLVPFQNSVLAMVQYYKDSGRALRLQMEAAQTLGELAPITDTRT